MEKAWIIHIFYHDRGSNKLAEAAFLATFAFFFLKAIFRGRSQTAAPGILARLSYPKSGLVVPDSEGQM